MKKYAVIGSPIDHSWSPSYFKKKFKELGLRNISYEGIHVEDISKVRDHLATAELSGFNVTIPYKQAIIPYLDGLSCTAAAINAVNTVQIKEGLWIGHNTDYIGFRQSIVGLLPAKKIKALIFGTGGASFAVKYALNQLGISYQYVSRSSSKGLTYGDVTAELLSNYQVLINTTPVGMFPKINEELPIAYDGLNSTHLCYDLVYNPERTKFLQLSANRGAKVMSGLEMLEIQAEKAWDIWRQ